jgi:hypothetical protein
MDNELRKSKALESIAKEVSNLTAAVRDVTVKLVELNNTIKEEEEK